MSARSRIGKVLRRLADRIDHHGAPRSIDWSFTFERGKGLVFHNDRGTGCPLYFLGMDEYEKAHREDDAQPVVMEERIPADLNPWAGAAVVALHNHTETDMCDDTCTTYGEGQIQ